MLIADFKAIFETKPYMNGSATVSDLELILKEMEPNIDALKNWPESEYFYTELAEAMETIDRKKILSATDFRTILKVIGYSQEEIDALLDPKFHGNMTVSDLRDTLIKTCDDYTEPNTTPPTITILGDNPTYITKGSEYNDAGATAADSSGTDISGLIVVDNQVDTSYSGEYAVYYEVTDEDGNTTTAKRTVYVYKP